jgi:N-acetyl-gamma-glutamyl-phosphate reductase
MIKARIVGAGGYGGVGMIELLLKHPEVQLESLVAKDNAGVRISELYPHLAGHCDDTILGVDDPSLEAPVDVVFFATPDGVGMNQAGAELDKGARVIDYSGDFRFQSPDDYADYATRIGRDPVHAAPERLPSSVYGLPELGLGVDSGSRLVGNPGCFAVSVLLGFAPAIQQNLVDVDTLIADCKTGVSGAGKKPSPSFHYPARYDHMNAYKLAGHQHVCEVEKVLGRLGNSEDLKITFTSQVVPATRGIMSSLYGRLKPGITRADLEEAYRAFHGGNAFVRLYDRNAQIGTAFVRGSNHCDLIVDVDERTGMLRVISHIDNLVKGQAGSALQNMNLLFDLPETMGLESPGMYP